MILNDIITSYFSTLHQETDSTEGKVVSPGELLLNDLFRGGVLYNSVKIRKSRNENVSNRFYRSVIGVGHGRMFEAVRIFNIFRFPCRLNGDSRKRNESFCSNLVSLGEQELSRSLILIMEIFESVTTNGQQILQADQSSSFNFCQTPIERMITDTNCKELFPNMIRFDFLLSTRRKF